MADSTSARYASLVAAGEIERDPAQQAVVARLGVSMTGSPFIGWRANRRPGWLFGKHEKAETSLKGSTFGARSAAQDDADGPFFRRMPGPAQRRVHFHAFMLDVHDRFRAYRSKLKFGEILRATQWAHGGYFPKKRGFCVSTNFTLRHR